MPAQVSSSSDTVWTIDVAVTNRLPAIFHQNLYASQGATQESADALATSIYNWCSTNEPNFPDGYTFTYTSSEWNNSQTDNSFFLGGDGNWYPN